METRIVRKNGVLMIEIDKKAYPPLAFKSFRANQKNISDFYAAGIRLFNILTSGVTSAVGVPYSLFGESWVGMETYDFTPIDRQIDLFTQCAPDAYFSLMIQLDTRDWWLEQHPGYPNSFHKLAQMETDPLWREAASKYMQAVIHHVEATYPDRFYAYFLLCGTTTEWFSDYSHEESSPRLESDYKKYCQNSETSIPPKKERETSASQIFLDVKKDANLINYRKFESVQRSDTVLYFAEKAQEVIQHKKLLGLYYGYLLELKDTRLWETGALDHERIFLSKDIDLFASPVSYEYRDLDTGSHQMLMRTTLERHNKIFFIEHDHTTSITPDIIEGCRFVHPGKVKQLSDDVDLMRRNFMLALTNHTALWWFDMFSGWFADPLLMHEISTMISTVNMCYRRHRERIAEVAIFGDPEAMYLVNKNSGLNNLIFDRQRKEWSYMGAPYDLYSACDYGNIDVTQYKMYIFLNAFCESDDLQNLLKSIQEKPEPTCILFIYAQPNPGCKMQLVNAGIQKKTILWNGRTHHLEKAFPCYAVENADIIQGCYSGIEKTAIGYEMQGNCITAVSGIPTVPHEVLTNLSDLVGVHRYIRTDDAIAYISDGVIGVYHITDSSVDIHLRQDETYIDVFSGRRYTSKNRILSINRGLQRSTLLIQESAYCRKGECDL